jgi:hypothetical protein
MEKIIDFLRKALGLELTIDSVVSRQSKVVRDLDKLQTIHTAKAEKACKRAEKLAKTEAAARQEAADAAELSNNWKNSGLIRPTRKAA